MILKHSRSPPPTLTMGLPHPTIFILCAFSVHSLTKVLLTTLHTVCQKYFFFKYITEQTVSGTLDISTTGVPFHNDKNKAKPKDKAKPKNLVLVLNFGDGQDLQFSFK